MTEPRVSVLIASYNPGALVREAVESVLAQTLSPLEIIVIDDGSTDDSYEYLRAFVPRIQLIRQANSGSNRTRNRLLEMAAGEWIQYLDADDYLTPRKLEAQLAHPEAASADVLTSYVQLRLERGDHPQWVDERHVPVDDPWAMMLGWRMPQLGGALWRKTTLESVGGWDEAQPCCQDSELYLRCLSAGSRFLHTETDGAVYREWSVDTISKRNVALNWRTRLELVSTALTVLQDRDQLSATRMAWANQSCLELARTIRQTDPDWAARIVASIAERDRAFKPFGPHMHPLYAWLFRYAGFRAAEAVAQLQRAFRRRS